MKNKIDLMAQQDVCNQMEWTINCTKEKIYWSGRETRHYMTLNYI